MGGPTRIERLNELLKRVIAESMHSVMAGDEIAPGLVTITRVECAKDLRDATVNASIFVEDKEVKARAIRHLQHNARRFQAIINRKIKMKWTPRLTFKLDLSLEKGDEVLALLNKLPPPAEN